jgi:hypothetical protein
LELGQVIKLRERSIIAAVPPRLRTFRSVSLVYYYVLLGSVGPEKLVTFYRVAFSLRALVFVRLENALVEVFLMQQNLTNFSEFDTPAKRCEILPLSYRSTTSRLGLTLVAVAIASFASIAGIAPASASSHMDAPLITLEPAANTTDVYAFVSQNPKNGQQYLTTAVAVYPFEEPGIGPNLFRFDDRVVYDIHVALGNEIAKGKSDLIYRFQFKTE